MIKTVFLDMDGVLVNFRKGIYDVFNQPWNYITQSIKWNFFEDWNKGVTRDMVNSICNILFWKYLEWMPDGKEIFSGVIKTFGINNIYLLTVPMQNPESGTGKILWVEKNIPTLAKHLIITQAPKSLLAKPDTLLIDDKNENVDRFYKTGGRACLVPRPWNRNHFCADRTVEVVKKFLKDLK